MLLKEMELTVKNTLNVQSHDSVPTFPFRNVVPWSTPRCSGVIYQDIQFGFAFLELRR